MCMKTLFLKRKPAIHEVARAETASPDATKSSSSAQAMTMLQISPSVLQSQEAHASA